MAVIHVQFEISVQGGAHLLAGGRGVGEKRPPRL